MASSCSPCPQCGLATSAGDHASVEECRDAVSAEERRRRAALNAEDCHLADDAASGREPGGWSHPGEEPPVTPLRDLRYTGVVCRRCVRPVAVIQERHGRSLPISCPACGYAWIAAPPVRI